MNELTNDESLASAGLEESIVPIGCIACLVQLFPIGSETRHVRLTGPMTFGRHSRCEIRIDDPSVSRQHAEIRPRHDHQTYLSDLGSRNGTFVNGHRISTRKLVGGDLIRIGNSIFRYLDSERKALS
jgi:pSer/pThr/pTyr-binding forkhead associated (FHA) protein